MPFKLDYFRSTGPASCKAQRQLHDLGAGSRKPHRAIGDRNCGCRHLSDIEFAFELCGEDESAIHLSRNRVGYELWSVSEYVRTHPLHIVDVLVAVCVPYQCAIAASEEQRLAGRLQSANLR